MHASLAPSVKIGLSTSCVMLFVQSYMNSVFDQAYGVLSDVSSVNGLLNQVETILDVDVNVTDLSADISVTS